MLRIEATVHNTKALKCGRRLDCFPAIAIELGSYVQHFMESIRGIDLGFCDHRLLDELPLSSQLGKSRIGGINLNSVRMKAVLNGVIALAVKPGGFKSGELAAIVDPSIALGYPATKASYDIRKLRAKGLVEKVPKSQRYALTKKGLPAIVGLMTLKEKVIGPLIARRRRKGKIPDRFLSPIDRKYQDLRREMTELFILLQLSPVK